MNMLRKIKGFGKLVGVVALTTVLALPLGVQAGYVDAEVSGGNSMTAGSLDEVLSAEVAIGGSDLMLGGSATAGSVIVSNSGSIGANYRAKFVKTGGDDLLCDALVLSATEDGNSAYLGSLSAFDVDAGALGAGDSFDWNFSVSLPTGASDATSEKACQFDIEFAASQAGLATGGYSDIELFGENSVTSGDWIAPAAPTGLRRLKASDHSTVFACGDISQIQSLHPDWDDNTESDFDHYEYTSFNAPSGSVGLNEKIFYNSIFEYNGSWLPGEGTYGFAVRAVDDAGNKSDWALGGTETFADSCQVTYDDTATVSTFSSPTDNLTSAGPITLAGATTDNNGVASVELSYTDYIAGVGGAAGVCDVAYTTITTLTNSAQNLPYNWSYDWTPAAAGSYCVKAAGIDIVGNIEHSDIVENVTYDPNSATLEIYNVEDNYNTQGVINGNNSPFITWRTNKPATSNVYFDRVSVPDSSVSVTADLVATYGYNSPAPTPDGTADKKMHSVTIVPQWSGMTYYRVVSMDASGNEVISDEHHFTFNMPPGSTPAALNPGDIVLNEIMPNPNGGDANKVASDACKNDKECGEWVELYNTTNTPIDVTGWRVKDASGKSWKIVANPDVGGGDVVADSNGVLTDVGETVVPVDGYLVVYRNSASMGLGNGGDTVYLYDDGWGSAAILMDTHTFAAGDFYEGKSIARFPDGNGPWIDPEGTPGEENKLSGDELEVLRAQVVEQCFASGAKLENYESGTMCDPLFVAYVGLIGSTDDREMTSKMQKKFLAQLGDGAEEQVQEEVAQIVLEAEIAQNEVVAVNVVGDGEIVNNQNIVEDAIEAVDIEKQVIDLRIDTELEQGADEVVVSEIKVGTDTESAQIVENEEILGIEVLEFEELDASEIETVSVDDAEEVGVAQDLETGVAGVDDIEGASNVDQNPVTKSMEESIEEVVQNVVIELEQITDIEPAMDSNLEIADKSVEVKVEIEVEAEAVKEEKIEQEVEEAEEVEEVEETQEEDVEEVALPVDAKEEVVVSESEAIDAQIAQEQQIEKVEQVVTDAQIVQ